MRTGAVIVSVLLVTSLVPPGAVGTAGSEPLADAGLDQEVTQGSTVYLDGGGSYAPDGEITKYEWTITLDGEPVEPSESTGERTTFEAEAIGKYEVTLTVTDDSGRTSTDTLYVEVEPGEEPVVTLDGPDTTTPGDEVTFTADVTPGDAPIDEIVWHVDGEEVSRSDADSESASYEHTSVTLGEQTVSVTVVDTAEQQDSAEHFLDVQEPTDDGESGWYSGSANRDDPSIHGPQLVEGEEPLEAQYELASSRSTSIDRIVWRVDGEQVATGTSYSVNWDPGRYQVSALVEYDDGTQRIATFDDGEREVVANPKPTVELRNPTGFDTSISGTVYARDDFIGVQAISVRVDGDEVQRWVDPFHHDPYGSVDFDYHDAVSESSHEVEVVVTDEMGQTAVVTEDVEVMGKPEIVSAEFLNEPVDSYHERIDPERYTAEFEMVVDPNGVDQENIQIVFQSLDSEPEIIPGGSSEIDEGKIRYTARTHSKTPGDYDFESEVLLNSNNTPLKADFNREELSIEQSPPEVRLKIQVEEGNNKHTRRIFADASDSFDPDGTDLKFSWDPDGEEVSVQAPTTTMNLNQPIDLLVVDGDGSREFINRPAINFYSPQEVEFNLQNEPYKPREMVKIEAIFEVHDTSDESFQHSDLDLNLIETNGNIASWQKTTGSGAGQTSRREAVIEVPVGEFFAQPHPKVEVYNEKNPDQTARTFELPNPEIENFDDEFKKNVVIADVKYFIESPIYEEVTAESRKKVDMLEMEGFEQYSTETTAEYKIEKHYYQEAEFETKTKSFDSLAERDRFLKMAVDWRPTGTETRTESRTTTETEWRQSMYGPGEFTGTTRRIQTQSARYRTLYEYTSRFGGTYWSTYGRFRGDVKTGRTKLKKTQSASFRTIYKFRTSSTERVKKTRYFAEKRVQNQRKIDEWREYTTTNTKQEAKQFDQASNLRIGRVTTDTEWNLRKEVGNEHIVVDEINEKSTVIETRAVVEGDLAEYYVDKSRNEFSVRQSGTFSEDIWETGYKNESELIEIAYASEVDAVRCEAENSKGCIA